MSANLGRAILEISTKDDGFTKGVNNAKKETEALISLFEKATKLSSSLFSSFGKVDTSSFEKAASTMDTLSKGTTRVGTSASDAAKQMTVLSSNSSIAAQSVENTASALQKISNFRAPSISTPGIGPVDTSSIGKAENSTKSLIAALADMSSKGVTAFTHLASGAGHAASEMAHLGSVAAGAVVSGIGNVGAMAASASGKLIALGVDAAKTAGSIAAGFGKESVAAFSSFEAQISAAAAVSGLAGKDLENFKSEATKLSLQLGAELPVSASQSASAITELTKAGFSAQASLGAARGTAILAGAANLDMGKSASIVANTISQFGLDVSTTDKALQSANRTVDILAKTANASAVDVSDLAETFKQAGPVAQAAGFSLEDVAKAAGVLGNAGIKASTAGTGLKSVISQLASPGAKAAEAFDKLGYSVKNADGTLKPLQQQLVELRSKFSTLSASEKIDMAKMIVGQDHFSKFLALMTAGEDGFNAMSDAIDNAKDSAAEMQKEMTNNLAGATDNMQGSIETLQIKIGKALSPALVIAANNIAKLANAAGPLADMLGVGVANGIAFATNALSTVKDWPVAFGQAIDGITGKSKDLGLVAGVINSIFGPEAGAKVVNIIQQIGASFGPLILKVFELYNAFSPLQIALAVFQGFLSGGVAGALDAFTGKITAGGDALGLNLRPAIEAVSSFIQTTAIPALQTIGQWIANTFGPIVTTASDTIQNTIIPAMQKMFTEAGPGVVDIVEKIAAFVNDPLIPTFGKVSAFILDTVVPAIVKIGDIVLTALLPAFNKAADFVANQMVPRLSELWGFIDANILPILSQLADFISGPLSSYFDTFSILSTTVWDTVKTAITTAWGVIQPIWNDIQSFIDGTLSPAFTQFQDTVSTVWDGISTVVSGAWDTLSGIFNNVVNAINNTLKPAFEAIGRSADAGASGIRNAFSGIVSFVKGVINGIISAVNTLISGFNQLPGPDISLIPMLAKGTMNFQGGMAIVGEQGPELVNLPKGSQVFPASQTEQMLSQIPASSNSLPNLRANMGSSSTVAIEQGAIVFNIAAGSNPEMVKIARQEAQKLLDGIGPQIATSQAARGLRR